MDNMHVITEVIRCTENLANALGKDFAGGLLAFVRSRVWTRADLMQSRSVLLWMLIRRERDELTPMILTITKLMEAEINATFNVHLHPVRNRRKAARQLAKILKISAAMACEMIGDNYTIIVGKYATPEEAKDLVETLKQNNLTAYVQTANLAA